VIAYQHGGGAGFESPLLRDPEKVKEDVLDEIVSIARAREKYGVVLTGSLEDYDIQVDLAATRDLREKMTEDSGRVNGLSHRH
jgi:N-methylhydantoinase B